MIKLQELAWNNTFSYGENNSIRLDEEPIIQLIGSNGAGKTSIPILIEEVLFGKNHKGIKKQDITNRNTSKKGYSISLKFLKNEDEYMVVLDRKSSLNLKLFANGVDISSHTSAGTYKTISDIIGVKDFKTFVQLIYQSSTDTLEFLTATDTNRKKFLINLLQLDKYVELHELFKKLAKEADGEVNKLSGSISTVKNWIKKHEDFDFTYRDYKIWEALDVSIINRLETAKDELANIRSKNLEIISNNEVLKELEELNPCRPPAENVAEAEKRFAELMKEKHELGGTLTSSKNIISKFETLGNVCPTCLSSIDPKTSKDIIDDAKQTLSDAEEKIGNINREKNRVSDILLQQNEYDVYLNRLNSLLSKVRNDLPKEPYNKHELEVEIAELTKIVSKADKESRENTKYNLEATAHNNQIDLVKKQLKEYNKELEELVDKLQAKQAEFAYLEILKNSFSTNGLISYKIESSIKELEKVINEYLAEFSYFQIEFKLSGEKLNIEVTDENNHTVGIESLSTGEKARVNISTLLAIRKTLSALTSTKINFLFLDEIVGVLDAAGKDKLIDILMEEKLNTFIVSHEGFLNPLVPKVFIEKEGDISRIEHG